MRSENAIVRELNGSKNVQKYERRTVDVITIDSYRGQAILHVPVGEKKYDFSFGIEKARAINELVVSGRWKGLMADMEGMQCEIQKNAHKMDNDVIVL